MRRRKVGLLTFSDGRRFAHEMLRQMNLDFQLTLRTRLEATGEYEDFLTGFVMDEAKVWGRPVGVTLASDGSLLVSDDGSNAIWRVAYTAR